MMEWFSTNATAIQAFSAGVQAFFAVILAFVGAGQWWTYDRQRKVMEETREIAFAGLGRPNVFIESVSHNLQEWRGGRSQLWFQFRFSNYGNSPAIVVKIAAYVFLSPGLGLGDDPLTNAVRRFPTAQERSATLAQAPAIMGIKLIDLNWTVITEPASDAGFVIVPGTPTRTYGQVLLVDPLQITGLGITNKQARHLLAITGKSGGVSPWLLGEIVYEDTLRRVHRTRFCLRGVGEEQAVEEYPAPYNERT